MESLKTLKKQLVSSPTLSNVLNSFMNLMEQSNIGDHQKTVDFAALKQDHELVLVIKVIEMMTSRFLSKSVQAKQPMLCEVTGESFYHGFCIVSDLPMPLTLFYFSDIQTGLFALCDFTKAPTTEIFRFSLAHQAENLKATH
jgi:hypothetical protein